MMQIHCHPTGKVETDQSEVGLYFIDAPIEETLSQRANPRCSFWAANYDFKVPPGKSN